MDGRLQSTTDDEIRRVREDVEDLKRQLLDPVEAARITYETLLNLRQSGKV